MFKRANHQTGMNALIDPAAGHNSSRFHPAIQPTKPL
jgi:hypothetical protein